MKTIDVGGESFEIKDYIPAEDMAGLNIFGLFSLTSKFAALGKDPTTMQSMQIVTEHIADFALITEKLVIKPKLVKPKFALVMGFISNKVFMQSFLDTFSGMDKIAKDTGSTSKKE